MVDCQHLYLMSRKIAKVGDLSPNGTMECNNVVVWGKRLVVISKEIILGISVGYQALAN